MKKLLASFLLVFSSLVFGFQTYTPAGTVDTYAEVNPTTGKPTLKQDLINNLNSGQPNRSFGFVFGRSNDIDNAICDLWEGPTCTYVFPATAQQMQLVSTSANDTLAGTGVQKVILHYLDNAYAVKTEIVSLNGTTPVNTVATNILRINNFHSYQVGSGGVAAGAITLKNTGATVTYSLINTGLNASRQAIYTVPAGVTGYITHWQASSGAASGTHFTPIYLRSTSHEGTLLPGVFLLVDEIGTQNNGYAITLPIPVRIPALADVKMSAVSDGASANVQVMGAIMGWFESP